MLEEQRGFMGRQIQRQTVESEVLAFLLLPKLGMIHTPKGTKQLLRVAAIILTQGVSGGCILREKTHFLS